MFRSDFLFIERKVWKLEESLSPNCLYALLAWRSESLSWARTCSDLWRRSTSCFILLLVSRSWCCSSVASWSLFILVFWVCGMYVCSDPSFGGFFFLEKMCFPAQKYLFSSWSFRVGHVPAF